jgi:hypothetical protein
MSKIVTGEFQIFIPNWGRIVELPWVIFGVLYVNGIIFEEVVFLWLKERRFKPNVPRASDWNYSVFENTTS